MTDDHGADQRVSDAHVNAVGAGHHVPAERPLKIFFWPASSVDGSFLYRVDHPAEALRARGHEVQVSQRINEWARDEADVIVGQRVALAGASSMWLMLSETPRAKRGDLRLVYEVDDNLFHVDHKDNPMAGVFNHPAVHEKMRENIKLADAVTVTVEHLAAYLRRYNPTTFVLPNSLDESVFDIPANQRPPDYPTTLIGWQGSATHALDWALVNDVVIEHVAADPYLRMRFLGATHFAGFPAGQVDVMPWTTDIRRHWKRVSRFDIGLGPLRNTEFNKAKSPLRFLELASLGVPAIMSNVPTYAAVVEHGRTGLLAATPAEWSAALAQLTYDRDARREIGANAREAARAWTMQARIHLWEDAYRSLF